VPGLERSRQAAVRVASCGAGTTRLACLRAGIPDADTSGHERGTANRQDSLAQLLVDYAALIESAGNDPARLGVLGFSYGAYEAALLMGHRSPAWLALRSPALYPDAHWHMPKEDLHPQTLERYRRLRTGPGENRALACCAAYRGDVLLIESECDEVIPRTVIDNYADAFQHARSLTRRMLSGADHQLSDHRSRMGYHELVVAWLGEKAAR
jgi:dienelactone hydrolase